MDHLPFLDEIQDNERYDSWVASGQKSVSERGREWCRNMLERYEDVKPTLDAGIAESLQAFVTRRENEINPVNT